MRFCLLAEWAGFSEEHGKGAGNAKLFPAPLLVLKKKPQNLRAQHMLNLGNDSLNLSCLGRCEMLT